MGHTTNPGWEDLTHLNAADQASFLREHLNNPHASPAVYRLRGNNRELTHKILNVRLHAFDYDGTLMDVGADDLHAGSARAIEGLAAKKMKRIGVTGRHAGQVARMPHAHLFPAILIEQGALSIENGNAPQPYLASLALVERISAIREDVMPLLFELAEKHDVSFIPTSKIEDQIHQMMISVDAMTRKKEKEVKIDDRELHKKIMVDFQKFWEQRALEVSLHIGSSSTGTFEASSPAYNKHNALKEYVRRNALRMPQVAFYGDSGNDREVFQQQSPVKTLVYNDHTPDDLVAGADLATTAGHAGKVIELIAKLLQNAARF